MNTFSLVILAIQSLALLSSCVYADRTVAVQRKPITFEHHQGQYIYTLDYAVNAKTFYPGLKNYMDNWFQVIQHLTDDARNPPTQSFWDTFYNTENYVGLKVSEHTFHALHHNAPHYKLRCEIELDITTTSNVQLAMDTMKLYSDGKDIFQMVSQFPKVRKVGGHGKLLSYNSKVLKCYNMPGPSPDQMIVLKRNFTPFKHSSFFGGKVKFEVSDVIQPIDLFTSFNRNNRDLVNVAYALNNGARRRLTVEDWNRFLDGQFTALSVQNDVYKTITYDPNQWRHVCSLEVNVPFFSLFTKYAIESMEILANGKHMMHVVDQIPFVSIIHGNGERERVAARVLSCSSVSTMETQSKSFKRAQDSNVIPSCSKEECKQEAQKAIEFFNQTEKDEHAQAEAVISTN